MNEIYEFELEGTGLIRCLHRSKRLVSHTDVFGEAFRWMVTHGISDFVVVRNEDEFLCFAKVPESF